MPQFADVAVLVPFGGALTYALPEGKRGAPGLRVVCEVRGRAMLGVILRVGPLPAEIKRESVREVVAILDDEPALPEELLRFLVELADYYFAPIGEVMRLALPSIERERLSGLRLPGELFELQRVEGARDFQARQVTYARATDLVETPGKLRGQAALVLAALRAEGEVSLPRLKDRFPNARSALQKLSGLGLATTRVGDVEANPYFSGAVPRDTEPELTASQEHAATRIVSSINAKTREGVRAFLLFGITGSGKTEVYLRAIAACLARRRGALVLVPEIALTPQLVSRYRARFGDEVAVVHSGLSERERHSMWTGLRSGAVRVAIGARSALFSPVPDLGLVIVDEEHEPTFKQEEGVRYHARDMALLRAHRAGATAVLGSATPSIEAFDLAQRGKIELLRLPDRAHAAARLPEVQLVDLRRIGPGPSGERLLSLPLHRALESTMTSGEQAILFLNRRGFAPSVVCESCGVFASCADCSVALTFHRGRGAGTLRCHYCDFAAIFSNECPSCRAPALTLEGLGTERLEEAVAKAFPAARVARLDRDVADGTRSEAILERMRRGEIDILVGTQMVTKGHDLPRVTLVGVLNADGALSLPDFRAAERTFALLVQVAGRAGRHDLPGRVLIQTRTPEHPAIALAARHDVEAFLRRELGERHEAHYPPRARLALLRFDAVDEGVARAAAEELARRARTAQQVLDRQVEVLGPAPAPIARLRGRFRFRVMLRGVERAPLRAVLRDLLLASKKTDRRVHVVFDVDPVSML